MAWLASFAIAVAAGLALGAGDLVQTPLLVAVILSATSLGVIIPVLKDAGEIASRSDSSSLAAGTIADFGAIILLSVFFSGEGGTTSTLLLIAACSAWPCSLYLVVAGAEHSHLPDRTTSIASRTRPRRSASAARSSLLIAFAALAQELGLEVILGAFAAGAC